MSNEVWIDVKAKTAELAIEVAMGELDVNDPEQLTVEMISEPVKGFLGMGGEPAVFRVKKRSSRRRRGSRRKGSGNERTTKPAKAKSGDPKRRAAQSGKNGGKPREGRPSGGASRGNRAEKKEKNVSDERPVLSVEEQAKIVQDFLSGLVDSYGLDGEVTTNIEDEVIVADVRGDQTEALVGIRGTVRSAIHELTRTVLQRYGQDTARLRLDIAGYAERRRQALSIYAEQLIEQLNSEGGEIMLEPMSPADRKVIHDVAAAHEGIASYSEGESPRRYVVLSREESSEEE